MGILDAFVHHGIVNLQNDLMPDLADQQGIISHFPSG